MTSQLATLRLEPAVHTHSIVDGRARRHPQSHFLDFLIDGVSLLSTAHGQGNLVTHLNRDWAPETVASAVGTLLGRRASPHLDVGRVALLVCGSCGDLACGAVTAKLDVGTKEVTWSEFRWENGYEDPEPIDSMRAGIIFDRAQYEAELADAAQRVATLPQSEPRSV